MSILYFLYGDDDYSIINKTAQIIKTISEKNQDFQLQKKKLTSKEELDDFFLESDNISIFQRETVLEITLSIKGLKYLESHVDCFMEIIKSMLEQKTIILVLSLVKFDKNIKKQLEDSDFLKRISSLTKLDEYNLPKPWQLAEITAYVKKIATNFKITFDETALNLFVECFRDKLNIAPSEISKLQLYLMPGTNVSEDLIKKIYLAGLSVDDFCNAIITQTIAKLPSGFKLDNAVYSPLYLIAVLQNKVRQIYYAKLLSGKGTNSQSISRLTGMHPYKLQKELSHFKNVSISYLEKFINILSDIEYKMKTGLLRNENSLDFLILSIEALRV